MSLYALKTSDDYLSDHSMTFLFPKHADNTLAVWKATQTD